MLSYSGITLLSFANKVVKVQPQKFVRSLYGVPRTLQYFEDFAKIFSVKYQLRFLRINLRFLRNFYKIFIRLQNFHKIFLRLPPIYLF